MHGTNLKGVILVLVRQRCANCVSLGALVCREGEGEKGDIFMFMFVVYCCLRVVPTFSFWNKELLDLT